MKLAINSLLVREVHPYSYKNATYLYFHDDINTLLLLLVESHVHSETPRVGEIRNKVW